MEVVRSATYEDVARVLRAAGSAVMCSHIDPDGDSIGCVLGLALALRSIGVETHPTLAEDAPPPPLYSFLPGFDLFELGGALEVPDVFVALDTPNFSRLGVAERLAREAKQLVVIDHHPDNRYFGKYNLVEPDAAATAQMVWQLLGELQIAPELEIATCLYTALVTDSGRFQYGNVSPATFLTAAEMVRWGVDVYGIYCRVYEQETAFSLALLGRGLSRITTTNGGKVAYSWADENDIEETDATFEDTDKVVDSIRTLGGEVAVVFFVKVLPEECRVSLRSKGETDVGHVARVLGGGGHHSAAGLRYYGGLQATLDKLLPLLPGHGEG